MDKYITLEDYQELVAKCASTYYTSLTLSEYEGVTLRAYMVKVVKDLKTFEVRPDDVWVVSYPKTGSTLTQEIVSCVMHDGNLEEVNTRHLKFRVPFIEQCMPESIRRLKSLPETLQIVAEMASPRVIKSHLQTHLLPPQIWEKQAKIIYILRNPKDMIVSFFHFTKFYTLEKKDLPFEVFLNDISSGQVQYGRWWEHYLGFWKRRHEPNILLLQYEDMKRDLRGNVSKICQFLGKNLSAEKLDAITEHCSFANMKQNPMSNMDLIFAKREHNTGSFMRKGKVGDWKSHFTVAQNEAMDAFIRETFHGTGLTFE